MEKRFRTLLVLSALILIAAGYIVQVSEEPDTVNETSQPSDSPQQASIGYIGCSNTKQTVWGYHMVSGANIWAVNGRRLHDYDGGAVADWVEDGNKFWDAFDEYLKGSPKTTKIWWQLCIRQDEADMTYDDTVPIIEAVRKRIPNVTIYVSPLAEYTENVCEITGVEGIERAKSLAQEIDSRNEDIAAGPVLGPLSLAEITTEEEDRCHLNERGMRMLGEQMKQFFDNSGSIPAAENVPEGPPAEEFSAEEQVWRNRVEAAMAPAPCPDAPKPEYPQSYYQGPLTDTHLHIPAIPDWPPEGDDLPKDQAPEGRFGGPQALLGWNVKVSDIACTIKLEGTRKDFAFFPVYEEMPEQLLEIWNRTMSEYPEQFTPFIMSSGNDDEPDGFPTVNAEALREMLSPYPGLFKGYGEIGLYARENGGSPELPPDAPRLIEIYPIARQNNLVVYFHLGEGHKDNFEKILGQNPDINFIWHGDQLSANEVEDILSKHPNAYYGVDAFWGHDQDLFHLFVGESKAAYLEKMEADFNIVLRYALDDWKSVIKRHPDQFIWGIDRGDAVWNYDLDVGQMQVKLARAFIGQLDPAVQEKFAYKNAERLLSGR